MNNNRHTKISVILPNMNGEKFLLKTIKSFLAQDYGNKELLVIDGKSSDASHSILKLYSKKHNEIRWIKYKDKGISDAINRGVELVRGDVIGYLGSDDVLLPDIFTTICKYWELVTCDAIYFDAYLLVTDNCLCLYNKANKDALKKTSLLAYGNRVGIQNIYFRRKVLVNNKFDVSNQFSMDYELYLRLAKNKYRYLYLPIPSTINIQEKNLSRRMAEEQYAEAVGVAKTYCKTKGDYYLFYRRLFLDFVKARL